MRTKVSLERWWRGCHVWAACLAAVLWFGCAGARPEAAEPSEGAPEATGGAGLGETGQEGQPQGDQMPGGGETEETWAEASGEELEELGELGEIVIDGRYIEIDGQEVRHLTCELTDAGGFALLEVVAALAESKAAFDGCAPQGAAVRVSLTFGTPAKVEVLESSSAASNACVAEVLGAVAAPLEGTCTMVLVMGEKNGAHAAADVMAPLEPDATE